MARAYFSYVPSGLSVRFINLSSGNPDSFAWDFGVTGGTSTLEAPIFLYAAAGVYDVTLTVTVGTETNTLVLPVAVSSSVGYGYPMLLLDAINSRLPVAIAPTIPITDGLIKKWQLFLATLIDPNIATQDMFNQASWPTLVNELIVDLCLYDIYIDTLMKSATTAIEASTSGTGGGSATGSLKKVTTGPSSVEYHTPLEASGGESAYSMLKTGGLGSISTQLKERICMLSKRLRIPLEICSKIPWRGRAPQVMKIIDPVPTEQDPSRDNTYIDLHTNPLNYHS